MIKLSPKGPVAAEASAETLLVCSVLAQALHDTTSANADVRREAETFWGNADAVLPWADILDLDVDALTQAVRRRRQRQADEDEAWEPPRGS